MNNDLIFFGIQGSGKGTQAEKILNILVDKYSYFSTGDVFRALLGSKNTIGTYLKTKLELGKLIPDTVTINLFHTYFATVLDSNKSMLLDGYPRTQTQINDLLKTTKKYNRKLMAVYFDLSEEEAIKRIQLRGRDDDTENAIKMRIKEYYNKTKPVIDFFEKEGDLIKINANQDIEKVFSDLIEKLEI